MKNDERSEATRSRVLDAALGGFTEKGYDATSVADICAAAGVSKGAFYHHFPSKQALFIVLLERWLAELDATIRAAADSSVPVPRQLESLSGLVGRVSALGSGQVPMFLEFWRKAAKDPAIRDVTVAPYQRFRTAFAGFVRRGVEEGSLRRVDPEAAALVLVSMGVGLVLQGAIEPSGLSDDAGAQAVRLLLGGLARR